MPLTNSIDSHHLQPCEIHPTQICTGDERRRTKPASQDVKGERGKKECVQKEFAPQEGK